MKQKSLILSCIFLITTFFSCVKEDIELTKTVEEDITEEATKGFVVYATSFDWENPNTVATPSGPIPLPWYGSNFLPERMKHTHPKSEGWEMLYNTMDLNDLKAIPDFFALYNKYSGVMHLFYIDLWGLESAEAFYTAFCVNGNSSLLNFEGKNNYGLNIKNYYPAIAKGTEGTITLYNNKLHIPDGSFVKNSWYGTEIEFAYENISSFSDLNFYLQYLPFRGKYQTLTMAGSLTGTIKGTVESKTTGNTNLVGTVTNMFNSSNNTDIKFGEDNTVLGDIVSSVEKAQTQATPKFFAGLWTKIRKEVPSTIQGSIATVIKTAAEQGIKWATHPISAFVTSVFSVGPSNVPLNKVDLKVNAKITLSGSIESQIANSRYDLKLPTTIPEMGGYGYPTLAMKDWGLGVWNVVDLPTANYDINNIVNRTNPDYWTCSSEVQITLPGASLARIILNPKVLNDCYITQQYITYKVESGNYEIKQSLDQYLPPLSYIPAGSLQSYLLCDCGATIPHASPLNTSDDWSTYARVTLVLKHKTSGQEFSHVKEFPLPKQTTVRFTYLDGDPGPGLEF